MTTIVLSRPRGAALLSRLIRRLTRSPVSHAMVGAKVGNVPVVIEATVGGVKITPRRKFERTNLVVAEFQTPEWVDLTFAVEHVGEHYDYVGLVGHLLCILVWRWFRVYVKNPLASPSAVVCSEFVVRAVNALSFKHLDPERVTPKDLLDACSTSDEFRRLS